MASRSSVPQAHWSEGRDGDDERVAMAWEVLAEVADPCSEAIRCPLSLVEMQIVKSVSLQDQRLVITLQLTEPSCIFAFYISETVEKRLLERFGSEMTVEIRLSHDYPEAWTEDSILPAARVRLERVRSGRSRVVTLKGIVGVSAQDDGGTSSR